MCFGVFMMSRLCMAAHSNKGLRWAVCIWLTFIKPLLYASMLGTAGSEVRPGRCQVVPIVL